jgi:transaldolase
VQLYLDSARLEEIRAAAEMGYVDGVTTNPALLAQQADRLEDLVMEICQLIPGPVCVPVRGTRDVEIVQEARRLAELQDRVIVKIPIHDDGLRAMARLHSEGIRTHATLCCSPAQALLAAKCGAYFVSPFVARLDASGFPGNEVVAQILEIYDNYEFDTRVMVASIRNTLQVQEAAVLGVDGATVSMAVLRELHRHPLSDTLQERYTADWSRT